MKIDVRGGRVLLVVGEGATAVVTDDTHDTKPILVAVSGSKLVFPKSKFAEPVGAYFANGTVVDIADTKSEWLADAFRFLGFTLRKRKPLVRYKKEKKREQR